MKHSLTFITRSALIAAIYFALSAALSALSFGPLQFRLSEALVLLAAFMPEAIPGLTVGCILTNFAFSPYSLYDMLFGGLATLLGAIGTYLLRKNLPLSALPPIILNALLVPLIWVVDGTDKLYIVNALEIFASEAVTVGIIGIPFAYALKRALTRAGVIREKDCLEYQRELPPSKDGDSPADVGSQAEVCTDDCVSVGGESADGVSDGDVSASAEAADDSLQKERQQEEQGGVTPKE